MTGTLSTPQFVYDPSTLEFQEHIWDVYRRLRDDHPLYVDDAKHQYVLSRFDDVWRAVNDAKSFSSVVAEADNFLPQMIYIDPPRHTKLRALVSAPSPRSGWPRSNLWSARRHATWSTASPRVAVASCSTNTPPYCRAW